MKNWIEKRTGVLWGTFTSWNEAHGPRPLLYLVARGQSETPWCRIEGGAFGRHFYVTWGVE